MPVLRRQSADIKRRLSGREYDYAGAAVQPLRLAVGAYRLDIESVCVSANQMLVHDGLLILSASESAITAGSPRGRRV